jgi:hypothetical protein
VLNATLKGLPFSIVLDGTTKCFVFMAVCTDELVGSIGSIDLRFALTAEF